MLASLQTLFLTKPFSSPNPARADPGRRGKIRLPWSRGKEGKEKEHETNEIRRTIAMASSRKVELRCDLCSKKVITEYDRDEEPILPIGWIEVQAQIQTQFQGVPPARIKGMSITIHACPKHKSLPLEKINR